MVKELTVKMSSSKLEETLLDLSSSTSSSSAELSSTTVESKLNVNILDLTVKDMNELLSGIREKSVTENIHKESTRDS